MSWYIENGWYDVKYAKRHGEFSVGDVVKFPPLVFGINPGVSRGKIILFLKIFGKFYAEIDPTMLKSGQRTDSVLVLITDIQKTEV